MPPAASRWAHLSKCVDKVLQPIHIDELERRLERLARSAKVCGVDIAELLEEELLVDKSRVELVNLDRTGALGVGYKDEPIGKEFIHRSAGWTVR